MKLSDRAFSLPRGFIKWGINLKSVLFAFLSLLSLSWQFPPCGSQLGLLSLSSAFSRLYARKPCYVARFRSSRCDYTVVRFESICVRARARASEPSLDESSVRRKRSERFYNSVLLSLFPFPPPHPSIFHPRDVRLFVRDHKSLPRNVPRSTVSALLFDRTAPCAPLLSGDGNIGALCRSATVYLFKRIEGVAISRGEGT